MADRVLRLLVELQVDRCAEECLHTLPGNGTRRHTNLDMSLVTQWKEVTFHAAFFGLPGQQNNPSGALMPGKVLRLDKCAYMSPLGIEHFFDALCFDPQRPWGTAAIQALGISSCLVSKDAYLENMHVNTFFLTPRRIPVERKASAAKREVDQDMVAREESVSAGSDAERRSLGVSDNSSTHSECTDIEASSIASDQDRFDTAYKAFQGLFFLLLAAKVRSSCEEGPGQSALQSAYHDPQLDVTELKQHRTT